MRPQISIEPVENQEARLIVGIDPGLSGALFFLDLDRQPTCGDAVDFPTFSLMRGGKAKREIDTHGLVILLSRPMLHAFVERASAMPGQGTTSMFSFGRTYGVVLGILAALGALSGFPPASTRAAHGRRNWLRLAPINGGSPGSMAAPKRR